MTDFFRPVSDLGDRYQIDLSDVHARIKFLGMVPEDLNGKAFIDANELKVMDALDGVEPYNGRHHRLQIIGCNRAILHPAVWYTQMLDIASPSQLSR